MKERKLEIRAWRESRFMTQAELAEKAGVSREAVILAEQGKTQPYFATIRKLAKAFGVEPERLYERPPEHVRHSFTADGDAFQGSVYRMGILVGLFTQRPNGFHTRTVGAGGLVHGTQTEIGIFQSRQEAIDAIIAAVESR